MTLVGLLPPICDNGNMLVDGGYGESASLNYTNLSSNDVAAQWTICL